MSCTALWRAAGGSRERRSNRGVLVVMHDGFLEAVDGGGGRGGSEEGGREMFISLVGACVDACVDVRVFSHVFVRGRMFFKVV